MKKWFKKYGIPIILSVFLLAGLGLILYPSLSNLWNNLHQTRAIASYVEQVKNLDEDHKLELFAEAEEYNKNLAKKGIPYDLTDEEMEAYRHILDITGTGIMGYIQINCLGVNLPIYHGTDEEVLQVATGHLEGSSLPIGGPSTHSILSGHRGLPSAKLFTDLDKMKEGDIFTITILDDVLTYEVDQISVVEPTDLSIIRIYSGEDYCTLLTCTPYMINSHRLLVRGKRIATEAEMVNVTSDAVQIQKTILIPMVLIPLLLLFLLTLFIDKIRNKKREI